MTPPWYVLTGGPCAGKTTLIFELEKRGYGVVPEPARIIIDRKLAEGQTIGEIVTDPDWLPSVVRLARQSAEEIPPEQESFFDRGVHDSFAYYKLNGRPVDETLRSAADAIRYKKVFLLDLVDFINDEARSETPEEARKLHELIREGYESNGYEVIPVPVLPVPERADFVLARL